jgi:iron complex outermembrane receptor protein
MPTLRERYTTTDLPNPNLDPEHALHYELGYRGVFQDWLKINTSLYFSDISDMISQVGSRQQRNRQFVNIDEVQTFGWELGAEAAYNKYISGGLTYSWMQWRTINNTAKLQNLPENMGTLYLVGTPFEGFTITPQLNMSGAFYDSSDNHKQSAFVTADLKIGYKVTENLSFEAGARNIFDKNYAYSYCYPEPGRNFFAGVTVKF